MLKVVFALLLLSVLVNARPNEVRVMPGHDRPEDYSNPLPRDYIDVRDIPSYFTWGDVDGVNYLTKNLNQHIPQYCGSCWAHAALSSLGDRIKIARKSKSVDVNLSIQAILNCGTNTAGSCLGGSHTGTYQYIKDTGYVPYDTCLLYEACSYDSKEGFCPSANYKCSAVNTCRTCSTFSWAGGDCVGLSTFPNASISEYGTVSGADDIMSEVYARGPIACYINAGPILDYTGGIFDNPSASKSIDHVVSIVGWGEEEDDGSQYWIVRNSWGEFWGEMGFFRIVRGENQLGIESSCAWATPDTWTEQNFPCYEDGTNCPTTGSYVDASIETPWHMH